LFDYKTILRRFNEHSTIGEKARGVKRSQLSDEHKSQNPSHHLVETLDALVSKNRGGAATMLSLHNVAYALFESNPIRTFLTAAPVETRGTNLFKKLQVQRKAGPTTNNAN
jgi:hypothetical protein